MSAIASVVFDLLIWSLNPRLGDSGVSVAAHEFSEVIINQGFLMGAKHKCSASKLIEFNGATATHQVYEVPSHGRWYYRYVCNVGHAVALSRHIPGGDVTSNLARSRALEVARWISAGRSPEEIELLIRSWPRKRSRSAG